jgi:hypothetical protein
MSRCFPFPPPGYEKTARPDAQLASHLQQQQQQLDKVEQHPRTPAPRTPPCPGWFASSFTDRSPGTLVELTISHRMD